MIAHQIRWTNFDAWLEGGVPGQVSVGTKAESASIDLKLQGGGKDDWEGTGRNQELRNQ